MSGTVWDPHLLYGQDGWVGGNRQAPLHAVGAYKTFAIRQPSDQAVRTACEDAGCLANRYGWETAIDETTDIGRAQASYIRRQSGRDFKESKTAEGLTVFRFAPHQRCFTEHRTAPQIFGVRDGDWRGNPTGRRFVHSDPADWVEDFGEHQIAVAEQSQRG